MGMSIKKTSYVSRKYKHVEVKLEYFDDAPQIKKLIPCIKKVLVKTIKEGQTFRQFYLDFEASLKSKESRLAFENLKAENDIKKNLNIVFDVCLRVSNADDQWNRIIEAQESHPYIMYLVGASSECCLGHSHWHGLMLLANDPWWSDHFPPNGLDCKCHVRSVSEYEAERLRRDGIPDMANAVPEINPETGLRTGHLRTENIPVRTIAPETRYLEWQNTRTGRTEFFPEGVEPGWGVHPIDIDILNEDFLISCWHTSMQCLKS